MAGPSLVRAEKAHTLSVGNGGRGVGRMIRRRKLGLAALLARVRLAPACTRLMLFVPRSTRPPARPPTLACKVILDATDEEEGAKEDGKKN